MHSYLVIMIMCLTFSIMFFPMVLFSLSNPSIFIYNVIFAFVLSLLVSIVSGWTMSTKFYIIMLKSYRMEKVLREVVPGVKFEPNFWLVLGSIILSKEKKVHRNDLKNNIDSTREVPFDFSEHIVIGYLLKNKTKYKPYKDLKTLKPLLFK